jgi:hypothetical protein
MLLVNAVIGAGLLTLGACASSSGGGATDARHTTLRDMCSDNSAFIARFTENEVSLDFGDGRNAMLAKQASTGPFHYSSPEFDMRGDTNQVRLTRTGGTGVNCLRGNPRDLLPTMPR